MNQEYRDSLVLAEALTRAAANENLITNEQAKRVMRTFGSQPDMTFAPSVLGAQAVIDNPRELFKPWYEQAQNQIVKRQTSANYAPYVVQGHHNVPIEAVYAYAQTLPVEQGMEFVQRVAEKAPFGSNYGDFTPLSAMAHQDSPGMNAHINPISGSKQPDYFGQQANELIGLNPKEASNRFVEQIVFPAQRLTDIAYNLPEEVAFRQATADILGIPVNDLVNTDISPGRGQVTFANRNRDALQKKFGVTKDEANKIMNLAYSNVTPIPNEKRSNARDNVLISLRPGAERSLKRLGVGRFAGDLLMGKL